MTNQEKKQQSEESTAAKLEKSRTSSPKVDPPSKLINLKHSQSYKNIIDSKKPVLNNSKIQKKAVSEDVINLDKMLSKGTIPLKNILSNSKLRRSSYGNLSISIKPLNSLNLNKSTVNKNLNKTIKLDKISTKKLLINK